MPILNVSKVKSEDFFVERSAQIDVIYDSEKYIPFRHDGFLDELVGLIYASPTLSGCVEKLTDFTVGQGFTLLSEQQTLQAGLTRRNDLTEPEAYALTDFLSLPQNAAGEMLLDVIQKVAFNLWGLGTAFVEVTKSKASIAIYCHEVRDVRPKKNANRIADTYGFSLDWQLGNVVDIAAFPTYTETGNGATTIIRVSKYALAHYYWGLPKWVSAKMWAEMEYLIVKRNISHFQNGMIPSGILQIFGNMTKKEADNYVRVMTEKFTGAGNDFKVLFQILRDPANKANFVPLAQQGEQEGAYLELEKVCKEMICTPMGISPSLLSAKTAGEIGSNQQLRSEFEALYNTVVVKTQNDILTKVVTPYLRAAATVQSDPVLKSALQKAVLGFINIIPVSFMGDVTISDVLTKDEQRDILGFQPIETQPATLQPITAANFVKNSIYARTN